MAEYGRGRMRRIHAGWRRKRSRYLCTTGTTVLKSALTGILRSLKSHENRKVEEILALLPQRNCGRCGYESCYDLAVAIAEGRERPDACRVAGKRIAGDIEKILRR